MTGCTPAGGRDESSAALGVERVFGQCSEHGHYELPLGSIDHGEVERRCPACAPVVDRLRLSPEPDTLSPGSGEGGVHFYESSITRSTGERLLSIVSLGRGMRLTTAQARELHDWIGAWLDAS